MINVKQRIKLACEKENISLSRLLMSVNIHSSDFYQAINGRKPFFKSWRQRISEALKVNEEELFTEYEIKGDIKDE